MIREKYIIGVDFGTDSVRAVIVSASVGEEVAAAVYPYPRWKDGLFCDASKNQFRQHPLDYTEGLEAVVNECIEKVNNDIKVNIKGLSVATTGSTPVAVDKSGTPLAILEDFARHPDAMFVLWKDHTAIQEALKINEAAKGFDTNYLQYVGGDYSSEWYWAKLLHMLRQDEKVKEHTYTFVEHSDWIPFLLTGGHDATKIKRNVCAAGHKGLWSEQFNGLPPTMFFESVDPILKKYVERFGDRVYTANESAGNLSPEWAKKLQLTTDVKVGIGAIDAHVGAVGGEIKPYFMTKVMGTSTCDMMIVPKDAMGDKVIKSISGQVEGSIVPNMIGLEAGQSAFGDIYSWFKKLLLWPFELMKDEHENRLHTQQLLNHFKERLLPELDQQASELPLDKEDEVALDWFNGRRTPNVNPNVKGLISGLTLGSHPPQIYKALVEATCMGSRAIVEDIEKQGIDIRGVNAIGGIATQSKYVIQTMADVLNRPIHVLAAQQPVALGAAMFAAVMCGLYPCIEDAGKQIGKGDKKVIRPNRERVAYYNDRFSRYERYAHFENSSL